MALRVAVFPPLEIESALMTKQGPNLQVGGHRWQVRSGYESTTSEVMSSKPLMSSPHLAAIVEAAGQIDRSYITQCLL